MKKCNFNEVKILKENRFYRISDLFYAPFPAQESMWMDSREEILNNKEFSNTILYDYLKNKKHEEDVVTFKKIVSEHTLKNKYDIPHKDELVFHIRLGDALRIDYNNGEFLRRLKKTYCNELYQKIDIDYKKIKKITFVTALHYGGYTCTFRGRHFDFTINEQSVKNSFETLEEIEKQTNILGFELNIKSSETVDDDFCYMSNAKYFVESESRFSRLISNILHEDAIKLKIK